MPMQGPPDRAAPGHSGGPGGGSGARPRLPRRVCNLPQPHQPGEAPGCSAGCQPALLRHGEGLCMHHKCICCWHDTWHMRLSWRGMAQAHMCSAIIQLVALCHATPCHALPCGASCRPPMTPHCCPSLPHLPTALQVVAARTLMSEDLATWRCQGAPRAEEILWGNLGFRVWERTGGPVWHQRTATFAGH